MATSTQLVMCATENKKPTSSRCGETDLANLNVPADKKTKRREAAAVSIRDCSKEDILSGLFLLLSNWAHGMLENLGSAAPTKEEEHLCLGYLESLPGSKESRNVSEHKAKQVFDWLVELQVHTHYKQVASHRKWILLTYKLFLIVGAFDHDLLSEAEVKIHDISKYGPVEAPGYGVMFGILDRDNQLKGAMRELWYTGLEHHLASNLHHPQSVEGKPMEKKYLTESLIDMLACCLERDLIGKPKVTVSEVMDLDEKYLRRYLDVDRQEVKKMLQDWKLKLKKMTSCPSQKLQEWFTEAQKIII